MPAYLRELLWDDDNEGHIAHHAVTRTEVEEMCFGDPWVIRAKGRDKRALYGQTSAGRYLFVILAGRGSGIFYPVTARDMTQTERRRYQDQRRR